MQLSMQRSVSAEISPSVMAAKPPCSCASRTTCSNTSCTNEPNSGASNSACFHGAARRPYCRKNAYRQPANRSIFDAESGIVLP